MRRMPKARGTKAKYRVESFYDLKEQAKTGKKDQQIDINVKVSRMGNKILVMDHVCKKFGDQVMLNDFSYIFSRYEKVGIIGPNGSGKSTFLNLVTNQLSPDSGFIDPGETIVFGYYKQQGMAFQPQQRLIDIVKEIAEVVTLGDGRQLSVSQFLTYFLFPPEMQYIPVGKLSGGERRRLYLMTILMKSPNFLILDEPTNDFDIVTLQVLEDYLSNFGGCLIIVSHDRFFMDKLVDHLFIFEGNGEIFDFPGNYSDYRVSQKQQQIESRRLEVQIKPKPVILTPPDKKKQTWKEKKELEQIELEIEQLELEKSMLETAISNASLNTTDLITKSNRLGELMVQIEAKTNRWVELNC
jgi:ATP-binding cassette subfamily F protein uup